MTITARVNQAARALQSNALMKNSAIYWTASLVISFINYLYYPILGRLMDPVSFGETQTIISIFTQATVFFQVIGLIGVGIITKYDDEDMRDKLTNEVSRLALLCSSVALLLTVLLSTQLAHFFHFGSVAPFLLLGISLLIAVPLAFANSYLQGHKRFAALSISNLLASTSKIVFSVVLVLIGYKTLGAVGGLVCAQILALGYALRVGKGLRHFVSGNLRFKPLQLGFVKPELPYAAMVFVTSLTTNLLLSFDILVVKHYFAPGQAGLYTGISIISNILFYITGPLAAVLVASVKLSQPMAENRRALRHSMILTLLIGGVVLALFVLAPHFVVNALLGHKFTAYAGYLRGLSWALFLMSVSNLLIYYHIGLRHYLVAPIVFIGLVVTLMLLGKAHATMTAVVHDLVIGAIVLLAMMVGLSTVYRKDYA